MTYQEYLQAAKVGMVSPVIRDIAGIQDAAKRCSPQEQARMQAWSETLNNLYSLPKKQGTSEEYDMLRVNLFQGMSDMISSYEAPLELFEKLKAEWSWKDCMPGLFNKMGIDGSKLSAPDFTQHYDSPAAVDARKKDLLSYAAQVMAFREKEQELSVNDMFETLTTASTWKKDRALINITKDGEQSQAYKLLSAGSAGDFVKLYQKERKAVQEQTFTFKEYADKISQRYRKREIDYAELELEMQALREITDEQLSKVKDPVERSRKQEKTTAYMPDFQAKVAELQKRREHERLTVASSDYQQKLAQSYVGEIGEMMANIQDVYGNNPRFHEEFSVKGNKDYTQEVFDRYLPPIDLTGYSVGNKPVTNEQFTALGTLAMYSTALSAHVSDDKKMIQTTPNENVTAHYHSHRVINFANSRKEIDGQVKLGPDFRAAGYIPTEITTAREWAKSALISYQNGDKAPLATILARGIRFGTDWSHHESKHRPGSQDMTADADSPIRYQLTNGFVVQEELLCSAAELMEHDPELAQEVRKVKDYNVTEADELKLKGFREAHKIYNAGEAAMKKLLEAARGGEQLSEFEKVECALAVQRRNTLIQSLRDHEKMVDNSPQKAKIDERGLKELFDINNEYSKDPNCSEAVIKKRIATATLDTETLKIGNTPLIFGRIGKGGAEELDCMAFEKRQGLPETEDAQKKLDAIDNERKRLAKLSAFELASELGITAPPKAKTTAQDVYNDLTREYKAGKLNYARYEERLRTMREMTGGNKQAIIDVPSIDAAIEYKKQQKEAAKVPVEKAISEMLSPQKDYDSGLGHRLRGIYDVYGLTPKLNQDSIKNNGYHLEDFQKLQDFQPQQGEEYLKVSGNAPIDEENEPYRDDDVEYEAPEAHLLDNDDFGALAVAVTQSDVKIGGVCFLKDENGENNNAFKEPTEEDASNCRTAYLTDACQGSDGARVGFNGYLLAVTLPAREKAAAALKEYNGGKGDPKELGKILGLGLHNLCRNHIALNTSKDMMSDNVIEGAITGRLASIIEKCDEKLQEEAFKYCTEEELDAAKGLKTVYDFTRASHEAMAKLQGSVKSGKRLPEEERTACIELLLRQKALLLAARAHAAEKESGEEMKAAEKWFEEQDITDYNKSILATQKMFGEKNRIIGLPEFVGVLGTDGPDAAKEMLDKALPNRELFFQKTDKEILAGLTEFGTKNDPFQVEVYKYTEKKAVKSPEPERRARTVEKSGNVEEKAVKSDTREERSQSVGNSRTL